MYSSARPGVNATQRRAALPAALAVWALVGVARSDGQAQTRREFPALDCSSALALLFAPARPQLGHYEVCTTKESLPAVAPQWRIEMVPPLDAFGTAGTYDRPALMRLYGGRRAAVARGWREHGSRFESLTLISPHPDATLTRLVPGTLLIRHVIIR